MLNPCLGPIEGSTTEREIEIKKGKKSITQRDSNPRPPEQSIYFRYATTTTLYNHIYAAFVIFLQIKLAFSQAAKLSSHFNRKTVVLLLCKGSAR